MGEHRGLSVSSGYEPVGLDGSYIWKLHSLLHYACTETSWCKPRWLCHTVFFLLCILWSPSPFKSISAVCVISGNMFPSLIVDQSPFTRDKKGAVSSAKLVCWVRSQSHVYLLLSPSQHLHQWRSSVERNIIHSATRVFQERHTQGPLLYPAGWESSPPAFLTITKIHFV